MIYYIVGFALGISMLTYSVVNELGQREHNRRMMKIITHQMSKYEQTKDPEVFAEIERLRKLLL